MKISKLQIWLQAIRIFSLTASMVPVLVGAAFAVYLQKEISWILLVPVLIASLMLQSATNLISDYYDFKKGVDKDYTFGSSGVLTAGLLSPAQIFFGAVVLFALTALTGVLFIYLRGWPIFIIGIIGIAGGILYTAGPGGMKYLGLGDITVFTLMGPLMVIGSFLVLTGSYNHHVLLISLPVGFLVAAILSANNLRDIKHDTEAGIKTTAIILGQKYAKIEYTALVSAAYITAVLLYLSKTAPIWIFLVLITLPIAIKNVSAAFKSETSRPEKIATLDIQSAQLHLAFGILLVVSLILGRILTW